MNLAATSDKSDPLGRYYTESKVSEFLISALDLTAPKTIVDLGSGSGSLSHQAFKKWATAKIITVDIDTEAHSATFQTTLSKNFIHYSTDALEESFLQIIGLSKRKVDAVVCNPPYLQLKWQKHYYQILSEAGLEKLAPQSGGINADILFIAQSIRLLKHGGRLGLILPNGVIAGEKNKVFRDAINKSHRIEKIVELPRRAFKKTDAKAHICIITKGIKPKKLIPITKICRQHKFQKEIKVPSSNLPNRLDYSYVSILRKQEGISNIGAVAKKIFRGNISSTERRKIKQAVFHITDFKPNCTKIDASFYITKRESARNKRPTAIYGDILLARVGRNLSEKIAIVELEGEVIVSDCILILRIIDTYRLEVFNFLTSTRGREYLKAISKGVGAQYITAKSVAEIKYSF